MAFKIQYIFGQFKILQKKKMLKVIGFHEHLHPGIGDQYDEQLPPPEAFHFTIDVHSILAFSVYSNHAVWVTKDGEGYTVGDNRGFAIIGTLEEKEYPETTKFDFYDDDGNSCKLLSVVCGSCYTLYHVQPNNNENGDTRLAFVEWNRNKGKPLFLNLSGWNAIRLFGGRETAAAIDESGSIIVITEIVFDSPNEPPPILFLPGKEKASCVACARTFIFALSLTGRVSSCHISSDGKIESSFILVKELENVKCVQISAMWDHVLAVTEDGRVFAFGSNVSGQIGLGIEVRSVDSFTLVETLSEYKIKAAFAGYMHSLFVTNDGTLLSCGRNSFGQLFLNDGPSKGVVHKPVITSIKNGVTFAIAGPGISAAFIDVQPPQNMPNMPLTENDYKMVESSELSGSSNALLIDDAECALLKEELNKMKAKNESLMAEIEKLKLELKLARENEEAQKKRILELEAKVGK